MGRGKVLNRSENYYYAQKTLPEIYFIVALLSPIYSPMESIYILMPCKEGQQGV